jgi:hypothetical protein
MNNKKVNLDLTAIDGNAFVLLAAFRKQAKREGWTADEIKAVTDEAKGGNYDHLVSTLDKRCEPKENAA